MKKVIGISLVVAMVFLFLSGCGVPQEEYDAVVAERDAAQSQVASLESDLAATESDLATAESDLAAAQAQVSQLEGFKTELTSSWASLLPKLELINQITNIFALSEAGGEVEVFAAVMGLTPYVDAVGDTELSEIWDQCLEFIDQGKATAFDHKFAELIDKALELAETDIEAIEAQLPE
jgi:outer membrane murein-binding lipoprotein Lpp